MVSREREERAMPKREYILAAKPVTPGDGRLRREIKERVDGGPWRGFAMVGDTDAWDVRELLSRAYRDGREDHAIDHELGPVASRFTPDEIEALVITAADAVHSGLENLPARQMDLAGRAKRIMDGR
jgi:hypothetical protein